MHQDTYSKAPGLRRSDLWTIHRSPAHFHEQMMHPKAQTPAMTFGIAVHKYILEPDTFFDEYAITPKVDRRTKAGKEAWQKFTEECEQKDLEPLDETTFKQIQDMSEALFSNPLAAEILKGTHESEWYWTDDETGEELKAKCDNITVYNGQNYVVDYKTTDSCEDGCFERECKKYGYQFQTGFYLSGVEKNTKLPHGFIFLAQEKKPPYACRAYICSETFLENGKETFHHLLRIYHTCKVTNSWYGYEGNTPNPQPSLLMDDSERFSRNRHVTYETGFNSNDYLSDPDDEEMDI